MIINEKTRPKGHVKMWRTRISYVFICVVILSDSGCTQEEDEEYNGKYIGKLNAYHHQIAGDVYAVDEYTLLLTAFSYDGTGADTFFWAGATNHPGPQGFIVPDEYGKTNVLDRYFNKDFTLTLPDNKKITDIKWFAIYDLSNQNTFGDVNIPDEFDPPSPQRISQLSKRSHEVTSEAVVILDAKTISIPGFYYDGLGNDTYFWVGAGPQPSTTGSKVPDEYGYLDPLRHYKGEDIVIQLPGEMTIHNINWLSVFDVATKSNYGSVVIPEGLNVPPSLVKVIKHVEALPNCVQLHKNYQVSWEIFGPQITIQLSGQIKEDEYMAFGLSGSQEKSQMEGADVTVAYMDGARGYAVDYNVTAKAPCGKTLGQYKGVCRDELVGGLDSNQMYTTVRENGVTIITYRRTLISSDSGDKEYPTDRPVYVIWALGRLDENKEPSFHDYYPKSDFMLKLNRQEPENTCTDFTESNRKVRDLWEKSDIFDRNIRTFKATIGPSGGKRGYQGITGQTSMGLAWYINGQLIPELYLRRGLTYSFRVHGGNNPHSPNLYHPLIITDEPHGGYDRLTDGAQNQVRVLAGVEFTRRGRPRPTAVGPLCLSKHGNQDRRLDDDFLTFKKFNRTLVHTCEEGEGGLLEVTPNSSWPDTVWYNSFTHANMGWKIHVVDEYMRVTTNSAFTITSSCLTVVVVVLFFRTF
ncbi:protein Skeletor, isoforms B/C-like isoform X1 [Diachasmimorpha longicaudata]|uniref:protein Skeletor, isoforms B/C-like isoform X1 n=1 Tax=Diachasmimorpha longicaudata TaxID=58733 RepID=UPI0030B885DC